MNEGRQINQLVSVHIDIEEHILEGKDKPLYAWVLSVDEAQHSDDFLYESPVHAFKKATGYVYRHLRDIS
ncbi:MAG TPA: hypothetical protein ACFE0H_12985 [Elainellaceae cyanobacterium]